jgi:hypothetical protein
MKQLLLIIAAGLVTVGSLNAQTFEERVAIEVIRKQAQLQQLDNYWAGQGYYRDGVNYQRDPGYERPRVGRTTKSAADVAKENPELFFNHSESGQKEVQPKYVPTFRDPNAHAKRHYLPRKRHY